MRFLLLAIIFCFALISPIFSQQIWSNCGTSSDFLQIGSVVLTPPTPVKGENLTISASGDLTETVTAGNAAIVVKYGFITLIKENQNICSSENPIGCPIAAGEYSKDYTVMIPSSAPGGKYTGNVVITDQNNAQIACINVDIDL